MSDRDIIDDIDALVDEQMAGGEPIGGYDYDDPGFPDCPHCSEGWHGLKITARMREMRWGGAFDEDYRYAEDESEVLCPGSDFIGPWATPHQLEWIRTHRFRTDPPNPWMRLSDGQPMHIGGISRSAGAIRCFRRGLSAMRRCSRSRPRSSSHPSSAGSPSGSAASAR
ncbi:hypothetical protein GS881_15610 [Rhodococcus hoagii]|nr:hypothetical protein [Prescottella equi]